MLDRLVTDICAVKGLPSILRMVPNSFRSAGLKRLLGRVPHGVPAQKIRAFTGFGWAYRKRLEAARTPTEITAACLWGSRRFCELILGDSLGDADAVYTFNSAGLELLTEARRRGLRTVMEQTIAPYALEASLLEEEHERYPDWEPPILSDPSVKEFVAREEAEWAQADVILCGSDFVRNGVVACGGPVDRCRVVPYGDDEKVPLPGKERHSGPLRVLTVGAVGLRKGSPYVLAAAGQLAGIAEFRMVGSLAILPQATRRLGARVDLVGVVPRSEVRQHFAWADVFLLPSLCEGSASVVYEALSAGLPVICTPNTGSVVRDGVDGYIVPVRDVQAMSAALARLAGNPRLLKEMSTNATERAKEFTLGRYSQRLVAALGDAMLSES